MSALAMVGLEQARCLSSRRRTAMRAPGRRSWGPCDGGCTSLIASSWSIYPPRAHPGEMPDLVAVCLARAALDILRLRYERDAAKRYAAGRRETTLPIPLFPRGRRDRRFPLPTTFACQTIIAPPDCSLSVPIFAGGLYSARQRQAELRARIADESLREAEDGVVRDVQVARLNFDTATQRLRTADQLVKHANQALELAKARYQLGSSSIAES